jgi:amino acid permease
MAMGLAALGVNKQLDLQSALTELGRILAADGGWYDSRHRVQRVFILAVGSAAVLTGAFLLYAMRGAPAGARISVLGACALLAFVAIRASSFHHVDLFIRSRWWGIRGNWLAEVGGLLVILAGAGLRWRERLIAASCPPATMTPAQ